MAAPVPPDRWAWHWECCVKCGTTGKDGKHIHKGRGLCLSCWDKKRYRQPKRLKYTLEAKRRFYLSVKGTKKYREGCRKRAAKWKVENSGGYKAAYKRRNLKERFIRYIKGGRQLKKYEKAIKFYCEDCEQMIQTCIMPDYALSAETSRAGRDLRIFKSIHEQFCQKITYQDGYIKL